MTPSATSIWASSGSDVYVALAEGAIQPRARIAHFDGKVWTKEELPVAIGAVRLWGAPGGDVFAAGTVGTAQPKVFRRKNGTGTTWTEEAAIAQEILTTSPASFVDIIGVDNENFLVLAARKDGTSTAWRKCGQDWEETPMTHARSGRVSPYGSFALDATHIFAFGGGIEIEPDKTPSEGVIFAVLDMFDGVSWRGIPIPTPLTDIAGITGSSIDDLFITAWNRNEDGTSRVFHVTDGMKTWTRVPSPTTLRADFLSMPVRGSSVFSVGCEWPDQFQPAPIGCSRLTRFDDPLSPTTTTATTTTTIDAEAGSPLVMWTDAPHGDLHAVLRQGDQPTTGLSAGLGHYRAHCE